MFWKSKRNICKQKQYPYTRMGQTRDCRRNRGVKMIKIIQLDRKGARLVNREPFLLPDVLQFDFDNIVGYDLSKAFISLKNGDKKEHLKLNAPFTVPDSVLFAGRLEMQIDIWDDDKMLKSFFVPPLQIVETDTGMQCFDVLAEYEKRLQEQNNRIIALENKHKLYK